MAQSKESPEEKKKRTGSCCVCWKESTERCARCRVTWYCSAEHQRVDWPTHKSVCLSRKPDEWLEVEAEKDTLVKLVKRREELVLNALSCLRCAFPDCFEGSTVTPFSMLINESGVRFMKSKYKENGVYIRDRKTPAGWIEMLVAMCDEQFWPGERPVFVLFSYSKYLCQKVMFVPCHRGCCSVRPTNLKHVNEMTERIFIDPEEECMTRKSTTAGQEAWHKIVTEAATILTQQ